MRVDDGEDARAGRRPARCWRRPGGDPGPLRHLQTWHPMQRRQSDQVFTAFVADGAEHVGDPSDPSESERVEWVPVDAGARAGHHRRRSATACR